MNNMNMTETLKLLIPILVLQYGLAIYCVVDILRKGVRNLNKIGWIFIVLVISTFGLIAYLLFGRKRWEDD